MVKDEPPATGWGSTPNDCDDPPSDVGLVPTAKCCLILCLWSGIMPYLSPGFCLCYFATQLWVHDGCMCELLFLHKRYVHIIDWIVKNASPKWTSHRNIYLEAFPYLEQRQIGASSSFFSHRNIQVLRSACNFQVRSQPCISLCSKYRYGVGT